MFWKFKINHVWGIIGKYVFPYSWLSFHFNTVFFSHAEASYIDETHLCILSFMSLALGDISMKILLHGIREIFLPMFSSRTFMVLWLIVKSFIHLEFIFVYGLSWWLSLIFFFQVAVQLSKHHLLKRLFLHCFMLLPLCWILMTIETWVYFCALYSIPLIYVSVLMPVPDCFDYCGLVT